MQKNTFRFLLLSALMILTLPFAMGKVKYPKTAVCPIDSVTAKATGKTKPTNDPQCVLVEYQHKWTDYTNFLHPQRLKHEFWVTICTQGANSSPKPSQ
jgi:hypothetical protein